ncbi:uncharacterized protein FIESC28_11329 [Fusarium coffeatum]|uniref:Uncharacterized protein n=1 Tax=Fusarium coffeatum TaxID=231269 RepID=A0A366QN79_9HYPO|nr:uncharacterized protein FIESC28_11329 [Fusarium coffeatum]RBR05576.1 hypothetical protein FIESC28_11329 [Fusarium coffeatum]
MTNQTYFGGITSEAEYKRRFNAGTHRTFSALANQPASEWGIDHLIACRVIRHKKLNHILPILSNHVALGELLGESVEIKMFFDGPEAGFESGSDHSLVRRYGASLGHLWAALSFFVRQQQISQSPEPLERSDNDASPARHKRAKRDVCQDGFVNSSSMQVGSSSPVADQASQGSSSIGFVDTSSQSNPLLLEDMTVSLARCLLQHILSFFPPQDSGSLPYVVEYRDCKTRLSAHTPRGGRTISARDDGGLFLRSNFVGDCQILRAHVALLEAKTRFNNIQDGVPLLSDDCFAQMTSEALAARLMGRGDDENERLGPLPVFFQPPASRC